MVDSSATRQELGQHYNLHVNGIYAGLWARLCFMAQAASGVYT